ncbi:MAG: complex I NDUFA9 subunit family protein [Proteobacteria bacterium]|nr:complex I NDUFA9 subunit family protein [Pseudomonadota bacterium]
MSAAAGVSVASSSAAPAAARWPLDERIEPAPQRVLVVGGSGFVGRHVVARLAAAGHAVTVITRRRARARHLILLPTVSVVEGNPYDPAVLTRHAAGATAAINLVGVLHAHGRQGFMLAHSELPKLLVAACTEAGIPRLVHMSALCASSDAPSQYLRSKAAGEEVVTASPLAWTVFRPSVIFGREDRFLNLFAELGRRLPVMVVAGARARFQPVFVGDVAQCIVAALADDATIGQRYDLCGPVVYTLCDLVRYALRTAGFERPVIALGPTASRLQARVMEWLPRPLLTRDNLRSMERDSVCDCPFPALFGLAPTALEAVAPDWLAPAARVSRFDAYRIRSGR